jgi:hypothetical protein
MSVPRDSRPAAPAPEAFLDEFEKSVAELRGAFIELLATIPGLPERPLQVARFLGLDKNLAWKLSRVARAADPAEAVRHLPGTAGLKRVLEACGERGADAGALAAVRDAIERFEGMVDRHTGDRQTLDLLLASGRPERPDAARMEQSRKLAFQGNSAICGIQARARFGVQILAPSKRDANLVDLVSLGGLVELRRLRPTAAWPLFSISGYSEDPQGGDASRRFLVPKMNELPLLHEFSSKPLPPIRVVPEPGGHLIELAEGPVGDTAAATCVFEWATPELGSVIASKKGDVAEFMMVSETPAELLVFDLLVHAGVAFHGRPSVRTYSAMHGRPRYPLCENARYDLPLVEELEELGAGPPVLAHPQLARHRELVETACARAGRDLNEFRGHRLTLRYPPIPAVIAMSYPLLAPR